MKKIISVLSVVFAFFAAEKLFAKEIMVSVGAGEYWVEKRAAQVAVWLEDEQGNYIRTLFVTSRAVKKNWIAAPKEGRPESLPVWYNAAKYDSAKKSGKAKSDIPVSAGDSFDAVTSATPKGGFNLKTVLEDGKNYVIKAEFNTSFDYNSFFTKKNSGVNGQPSVVYKAELPKDFTAEIQMELAGNGALSGEDGKIHSLSSELTTALKIVKSISIVGL